MGSLRRLFTSIFGVAKHATENAMDKAEELATKAKEEIKESTTELREKAAEGLVKAKAWTEEAVE